MNYNACDKCDKSFPSNDLIWVSAEDFRPKQSEYVPEKVYNEFDALCKNCYFEEIEIRKKEKPNNYKL